jgi:hypothetical protein
LFRNLNSHTYRERYGINLVIVLDGVTPKYLSEKEKILEKSKNVWTKLTYNESNENLKIEMIKNYGVRYYHQEIVSEVYIFKILG